MGGLDFSQGRVPCPLLGLEVEQGRMSGGAGGKEVEILNGIIYKVIKKEIKEKIEKRKEK